MVMMVMLLMMERMKTLMGTMEQVVTLEQAMLFTMVILIKLNLTCHGHKVLENNFHLGLHI